MQSFRDPENFAVFVGGNWYRVASPGSSHAINRFLESDAYTRLVKAESVLECEPLEGSHAKTILEAACDYSLHSRADNNWSVFRVGLHETISYPWEWPDGMLRSAGLLTLRLRRELLNLGLDLKDASAFNVQFRGSTPVFIDFGSIEEWRPNPGWNATRQYVEHFINPLAVGRNRNVSSADAWSMMGRIGVSSRVARELMPNSLRFKLSLAVLQAVARPIEGNGPTETLYETQSQRNLEIARTATLNLTKRLEKGTQAISTRRHKTTWSAYTDRSHYGQTAILRKLELARSFVESLDDDDGPVLDIGGNDGLVAVNLSSTFNIPTVVLESDVGALDGLHARLAEEPGMATLVMPLVGDITHLFPRSGVLNKEYASFQERVRPRAVLCHSVLHHVVITQGVPIDVISRQLAMFGCAIQIEFVGVSDPKVKSLLRQVPNWSGEYSLDAMVDALSRHFRSVLVSGNTTSTRLMIEARGPLRVD